MAPRLTYSRTDSRCLFPRLLDWLILPLSSSSSSSHTRPQPQGAASAARANLHLVYTPKLAFVFHVCLLLGTPHTVPDGSPKAGTSQRRLCQEESEAALLQIFPRLLPAAQSSPSSLSEPLPGTVATSPLTRSPTPLSLSLAGSQTVVWYQLPRRRGGARTSYGSGGLTSFVSASTTLLPLPGTSYSLVAPELLHLPPPLQDTEVHKECRGTSSTITTCYYGNTSNWSHDFLSVVM